MTTDSRLRQLRELGRAFSQLSEQLNQELKATIENDGWCLRFEWSEQHNDVVLCCSHPNQPNQSVIWRADRLPKSSSEIYRALKYGSDHITD